MKFSWRLEGRRPWRPVGGIYVRRSLCVCGPVPTPFAANPRTSSSSSTGRGGTGSIWKYKARVDILKSDFDGYDLLSVAIEVAIFCF